MLHLRN